jgi:hypothetical protein
MAYPIRFRLVHKETLKPFDKGEDKNKCPVLLPDGTPAQWIDLEYYPSVRKLSCGDYDLYVALKKDSDGNWIYEKVGY